MGREEFWEQMVDNRNQSGRQFRGEALHRLFRTFEAMSAGLRKQGLPRGQADYHALYTAFRLEGWSDAEARASASRLMPKH